MTIAMNLLIANSFRGRLKIDTGSTSVQLIHVSEKCTFWISFENLNNSDWSIQSKFGFRMHIRLWIAWSRVSYRFFSTFSNFLTFNFINSLKRYIYISFSWNCHCYQMWEEFIGKVCPKSDLVLIQKFILFSTCSRREMVSKFASSQNNRWF